jgi:hypothetical protein
MNEKKYFFIGIDMPTSEKDKSCTENMCSEPIQVGYIRKREILIALPRPVGDAYVVDAWQKNQCANHDQWPRTIAVLKTTIADEWTTMAERRSYLCLDTTG